jgi:hypothetical protein
MTTYTKLRSGSWGVRIVGSTPTPGTAVNVSKKDGTVKQETIAKVVWSGLDRAGQRVSLCAIEPSTREDSSSFRPVPAKAESGFRPVRGCADCARLGRMCKQCRFDEYDC